jgi:hypothetical protein
MVCISNDAPDLIFFFICLQWEAIQNALVFFSILMYFCLMFNKKNHFRNIKIVKIVKIVKNLEIP